MDVLAGIKKYILFEIYVKLYRQNHVEFSKIYWNLFRLKFMSKVKTERCLKRFSKVEKLLLIKPFNFRGNTIDIWTLYSWVHHSKRSMRRGRLSLSGIVWSFFIALLGPLYPFQSRFEGATYNKWVRRSSMTFR